MIDVIIPTKFYNIGLLKKLIKDILNHPQTFITLIKDNRIDIMLSDLTNELNRVKIVNNVYCSGFTGAIKTGFQCINSDKFFVLNDDIEIDNNFFNLMLEALDEYDIIGPVSNYVGGIQMAEKASTEKTFILTNFLSGFCLGIKRAVIENIDFNCSALKNYFSDNYLCYKAIEAGFKLAVATHIFVKHYGSQTINIDNPDINSDCLNYLKILNNEVANREDKVAIVMRVKNGVEFLKMTLEPISRVGDFIVILVNPSEDNTLQFVKEKELKIPKIIIQQDRELKEVEDRELLDKVARDNGATWVIYFDADEMPERKWTKETTYKLIKNSIYPEVRAYHFRVLTFWRGLTHHRIDGVWGGLSGTRLYRIVPNHRWISHHIDGLHCFPEAKIISGKRYSGFKILHFGYHNYDLCYKKFNYYNEIDKDKRIELIGTPDYSHLIDETNMSLEEYKEKYITLIINTYTKDKMKFSFFNLLRDTYSIFDDILVGIDDKDNGFTKQLLDVMKVKYKYIKFDNYSQMRNELLNELKNKYLKENNKENNHYVFYLDDDEVIEPKLLYTINEYNKPVIFEIFNKKQDFNFYSYTIRYFPLTKDTRFNNYVHELINISPDKAELFKYNCITNISLNDENKEEIYKELILRELKEKPSDEALLNYAKYLIVSGDYSIAENILLKEIKSSIPQRYSILAFLQLLKAYKFLEETKGYGRKEYKLQTIKTTIKEILNNFPF